MHLKVSDIREYSRTAFNLAVIVCMGFTGESAQAQTSNVQSVYTMSGARTTGGSMVGITAGGQIVSGISQGGGSIKNYSGFLAALVLSPAMDNDKDGICDELDTDNDNDGIDDVDEILGSRFAPSQATDPNNADSDGDQLNDGSECAAGTSPTNNASVLAITQIRIEDGAIRVFWTGGSSVRQILMRRTNLMDTAESWQPVFTNYPPTLTMTSTVDAEGTNTTSFYKLVIESP